MYSNKYLIEKHISQSPFEPPSKINGYNEWSNKLVEHIFVLTWKRIKI